jgi:hypothetical protein
MADGQKVANHDGFARVVDIEGRAMGQEIDFIDE